MNWFISQPSGSQMWVSLSGLNQSSLELYIILPGKTSKNLHNFPLQILETNHKVWLVALSSVAEANNSNPLVLLFSHFSLDHSCSEASLLCEVLLIWQDSVDNSSASLTLKILHINKMYSISSPLPLEFLWDPAPWCAHFREYDILLNTVVIGPNLLFFPLSILVIF